MLSGRRRRLPRLVRALPRLQDGLRRNGALISPRLAIFPLLSLRSVRGAGRGADRTLPAVASTVLI